MIELIEALHFKDRERALTVIQEVVANKVDMKLFARLLLEHVRAVMLLRNLPSKKEAILNSFGPEARTKIEEYARGASPLNSHLLLRLIQVTELIARSPIPQAPLEIALIEMTEASV
jgi:DNA polymerase III gamma/tau subunit